MKQSIFTLFGYALFFSLVGADPGDFLFLDTVYFFFVVTVVLACQLLAAHIAEYVLARFIPKLTLICPVGPVVLSMFVFANAFFFVFINIVSPLPLEIAIQLSIALFYFFSVTKFKLRKAGVVFPLALLAISIASYSWRSWQIYAGNIHVTQGPLVDEGPPEVGEIEQVSSRAKVNILDKYEALIRHKIPNKRNIYLLFFESLVSERSLEEIFNTTDRRHFDYLRKVGFRVFNGISAGPGTWINFGRILEYPLSRTLELDPTEGHIRLYAPILTGEGFVPIYEILKNNGYGIQGIFSGAHRGRKNGTFDYSFESYHTPGSCDYVSYRYLYFGCLPGVKDSIQFRNRLLRTGQWELRDTITQRLESVAKDERPWFTLLHHPPWGYPVHTNPNSGYSWINLSEREDFIKYYVNGLDSIQKGFKELNEAIRKHDPDGIIIFAGDHGAQVTRGALPAGVKVPYRYLDNYSVGIGVSPGDFCNDLLKEGMVTVQLMEFIVSCLSDGNNPFEVHSKTWLPPEDQIRAINAINLPVLH